MAFKGAAKCRSVFSLIPSSFWNIPRRGVITSSVRFDKEAEGEKNDEKPGWFSGLMRGVPGASQAGKKSISASLADETDACYEMQFHSVRADLKDEYIKVFQNLVDMQKEKFKGNLQLVGSWSVDIGDQGECIHLWKYKEGMATLQDVFSSKHKDPEIIATRKARNKLLVSHNNQILLKFGYWPDPDPSRVIGKGNIYELRTYVLKPGSLIEFANNWARNIYSRMDDASVGVTGMFTNLGSLYTVHHLWVFKDLLHRRENRQNAWRNPGWDRLVANTVPLIRDSKARILMPFPFSPLQ